MITAKQMHKKTKDALKNKGSAKEVQDQVDTVSSYIIHASDACRYQVVVPIRLFPGTVRKLRAAGFKVENCSTSELPRYYITW